TRHCTGGLHRGEDCADLPLCADDGTTCGVTSPRTCDPARPDGARCFVNRECASGVCDLLTSICTPEQVCF
ncbi:MAG: hypothetical protein ABIY55_36395, partial [Kofleriaceae bacterium]